MDRTDSDWRFITTGRRFDPQLGPFRRTHLRRPFEPITPGS